MKSAIFATLLATAAAFAPASETASASSALSAFKDDVGAITPLGYFDPLGLTKDGDQAKFDRLRLVEVKHGRIAMMAVVGYLVTAAGTRFDGLISYDGTKFADIPSGFAALDAIPTLGLAQILIFIGVAETVFMKDITGGEFPGDFRNGFLDFGWDSYDQATKNKKRSIELNQGRAAQMGILGLMVHDKLGNIDAVLPPF
mmetsp:Transcript_9152/g.12168  ORF Transcript_9152/g.12168 Transcript_9152/m.12168 type:complete len:200 (-) Transcript_9152:180-779(-)|eukprot:CAMPEP_0198136704 /NCGR_PEP_ID=MMETSP1443-20131203/326_1 /TAXON_ID=186043 /ORGANISM="Entomoneis sp., Strain CCMP2396" /LENGTH=199 /DNA_ID=CAMNT_0043797965 /DNA_START=37 /DNA_END=636 /DNA_ORIENTATION=-